MNPEELRAALASGQARRVHLTTLGRALAPRGIVREDGRFEKESLAGLIWDNVMPVVESWTNPEYADAVPPEVALVELTAQINLQVEAVLIRLKHHLNPEGET